MMTKPGDEKLEPPNLSKQLRPEPKANILLVDDEPAHLLALRSILEDLGQNLVEAHSGEEALRRVREDEFAVVLLDVQMPTLDGFETAKLIREQDQNRHTPIMFLTAHESGRDTLEMAYSLGAVDYLVKPLVPSILNAKVAGFVELFQAKARAKREADQLRLLVQGTTEYAIFMLDAEGHVLTWNPGAERIKGYRAEEIIGRHFSQFYPQEALQRGWPDHELAVARTQGRFEDEGWRVRKDGTQFWANVVITALRDEAGNLQGFSKITRDMTDRKQAEESARRLLQEEAARLTAEQDADIIQEQRERLHVTLSSIGDAVISTDAEGRVTFLNPVAQALTGWKSDEAQGKPLTEVFRIVNEHTRQSVENPALRAVQEGVIVGLANHTLLIARDGTERPIDDSAAPIRDPLGKVVGAVLVFRDITERKQAESAIRESEARKGAILETALDCIITMDHEGKVVEFNPAAETTFGYSRAEVVGRPLADLIIPSSLRDRHHQGLANYLATGEGPVLNKRIELPALHADGTEFPVELAITRIPTAGPPLFTAYLREIGERTRIEARRRARLAVTQILAEATTVRDAAARLLQAICENLGWDVGLLWTVDEEAKTLRCAESWHRLGASVEEFEATSRLRNFTSGEGLPGRVWATRKPVWIPNVEQDGNFPRIAIAAKEGIRGAFACPVVVGVETLGVIEFFSRRIQEPDAGLLEMMDTVGGQIGQFMERKQAEGQLRQSEQELADFFENASVGLHWVGPDGIILRVNQAELDMLGYSREEYVGRPIAEFHADEKVICDILEKLRAGEKLSEYPARLKCKDGSLKDVLIDSSVLFKDGSFVHTRCFTRDVTERKRAETKVREQEQRTRTILESVTDAFCALDRDWRFTYVNRQAEVLMGRSRDDLLGRNRWEVYPDTIGTDVERNFRRAMAENVTTTFEFYYPPDDRWYEFHAYPSPDGLSVYFRDVSERRRAETTLRESEEKFRQMAETIPQLAWMARPDGHIYWYNSRWYEYTGTTPSEMEGWGWKAVHDPDVLPDVLERWKASLATGEAFDMVFPLRGSDGVLRPFLTRVMPLRAEDGSVLHWFGTNTEITELKEARQALASSEERLRLALEAGRMGVWDWDIRTNEVQWSDSLEPLHGLAPGTFGGTLDDFRKLIHPDDREMVNNAIQEAVKHGSGYDIEFRNVWPNGITHWIAGKGKVFAGNDGQPGRMIGIGMDVSQRKRSEQTARFLADASATLAALVDFDSTIQKVASLAVPYFADWATVDLAESDGTLRRVAVAHVDPAKIELAHDVHRRFPPDPTALEGVWNILRTGQAEIVPEITDDLLGKSIQDEELLGIMRELGLKSYMGVPLNVRGKTLGVITFIAAESGHRYDNSDLAVAQDLADRAAIAIENTQLYRELRQADQRKDEFLATLAHELRNPLAPIRNALEVMRLAGNSADAVEQSRRMMERQVVQMVRLVDDLLDVSRITRNKLDLRKERIELVAVVRNAIETSRPLIDQSGHELTVTLPPEPIYLDADSTRLEQVFSNLLNNSAKYTERGGHIWLTVEPGGGKVLVRVRDTGIGIPAEALPGIFEMFSQVDGNLERAQGGLGIGLTLVRRLVEMHGGSVKARSAGRGHGSEFLVRLPMVGAPGRGEQQSHDNGEKTIAPKRRILVVDDNRDSATTLSLMLSILGNEIHTAHDGLEAVEAAAAFRPDVILLDIGLPKLNGYDACRRIREQPWGQGMVIVALTGWGQEDDRRRSQAAGFNHHVVKPVDPAILTKLLAGFPN